MTSYNTDNVFVMYNPGNGSLEAGPLIAVGDAPTALVAIDMNDDDRLDLVVANDFSLDLSILLNNGGGFSAIRRFPIGHRTSVMASADIDGDGLLDIAVLPPDAFHVSILRNRGQTALSKPSSVFVESPVSLAFGNFDTLTGIDMAVLLADRTVAVLSNDGNGGFSRPSHWATGLGSSPLALDVADLDGDRDDDIVVSSLDSASLLRNNGGGLFAAPVTWHTPRTSTFFRTSVDIADFDLDERLDIMLPGQSQVRIVFNRSTGGSSGDCHLDRIPDDCQLEANDCNANHFPDDCEPDIDADATPNSCDRCPMADDQLDTDGDSVADCLDTCMSISDPQQKDRDSDGAGDACDLCADDADKIAPGICGCGTADRDSDFDDVEDCLDLCPNDNSKSMPGVCGCDRFEDTRDEDGDGSINCRDNCRSTANAGQEDGDDDGTGDQCDECPDDAEKVEPNYCGCGVAETDTDQDFRPDCVDGCPQSRIKIEPGVCGCLERDLDRDRDLALDCMDGCPLDRAKVAPGRCGCGFSDSDGGADIPCATPTPSPTATPTARGIALELEVNSETDAVDVLLGDGLCATSAGECTLRAAVQETNVTRGPDRIYLPAGNYRLTIAGFDENDGATGDLDVTDNLQLVGDGPDSTIVDANDIDRIIEVAAGVSVSLSGISLRNGQYSGGELDFDRLNVVGGLLNRGVLTLRDCRIVDNVATPSFSTGAIVNLGELDAERVEIGDNRGDRFGGIRNQGTLRLENSLLFANVGRTLTAALHNEGSAALFAVEFDSNDTEGSEGATIANFGTMVLDQGIMRRTNPSLFLRSASHLLNHGELTLRRALLETGNSWAIVNRGSAMIADTTVRNNGSFSSFGGGLRNLAESQIVRSTFSENYGHSAAVLNTGNLTAVNSTFSGNHSLGIGGAITNQGGTARLNNVTIVGNEAQSAGGIANESGTVHLSNTILAANRSRSLMQPECAGTLQSLGYNLIEDARGCNFVDDGTDLEGASPELGPLRFHGGATLTQRLSSSSPALDAGSPAPPGSGDGACEATDQSNVERPQGAQCDIGALEASEAIPTPSSTRPPLPTATPTPKSCPGDCGADSQVTVDDIVKMINIALGQQPTAACGRGDVDGSNTITVDEIVLAINNALTGCRG